MRSLLLCLAVILLALQLVLAAWQHPLQDQVDAARESKDGLLLHSLVRSRLRTPNSVPRGEAVWIVQALRDAVVLIDEPKRQAEALNDLGAAVQVVLGHRGDVAIEDPVEVFKMAVERDPGLWQGHANLAQAYSNKGDYAQAAAALKAALQLSDQPALHFLIGNAVFHQTDDAQAASAHWLVSVIGERLPPSLVRYDTMRCDALLCSAVMPSVLSRRTGRGRWKARLFP